MDRRLFLLSSASFAIGTSFHGNGIAVAAESLQREDLKLLSVFKRIYEEILAASPETATLLGEDTGATRGKLDDRSTAADASRLRRLRSHVAILKEIDVNGLSPDRARQWSIALGWLAHQANARTEYPYGDERFFAYPLTQFTGAYAAVPQLLRRAQLKSDADVEAYLSRLEESAKAIDDETDRQQEQANKSILAPGFILDIVLANLKHLRQREVADKAFVNPLNEKAAAAHIADRADEALDIVERAVLPALDRQISVLETLRPSAPDAPGVWQLPMGDAFYADALYFAATSKITPAEAHQVGLEKVEEIYSKLDALLIKQGYTKGTCGERLEAIKQDNAQYFPADDLGRAALIAYLQRDVASVHTVLPNAFATLPEGDLEVRRMPALIEGKGPSAYYDRAPEGSSRMSAIVVDLKEMSKWPRFSLKTLCRHEGVPGHHLQNSLAFQAAGVPKLLTLFASPAYSEGWALYAEQLTQEMGLYEDDPMSEIGMWQSLLFRAARIVVDTGIHYKRWSRARAVEYMVTTTALPQSMVETEINRYTVIPGQACAYMIGQIGWHRIRSKAQARFGRAFDLRTFHDVLCDGMMPMEMLEQHALKRLGESVI